MSQLPRVLCLGEALIDLTTPPDETLETANSLIARPGGAPLNVAVHLKRAGLDPLFAGALSADGFGDRLRHLLHQEGVPFVPEAPVDAPTRLAVIDRRPDHPPFQFYGDRPADSRLTVEHVEAILDDGIDAAYAGSLMMIDPDAGRTQVEVLHRLASGNAMIACDPNPRPTAWTSSDAMRAATETLLGFAHLFKLSLDDARAIGWPDEPKTLAAFIRQTGNADLVITDGANGCWLATASGTIDHYSVPETLVVDSTGAGDAFFAAVIAGRLRDGRVSPETMLEAAETGARVAGQRGAF